MVHCKLPLSSPHWQKCAIFVVKYCPFNDDLWRWNTWVCVCGRICWPVCLPVRCRPCLTSSPAIQMTVTCRPAYGERLLAVASLIKRFDLGPIWKGKNGFTNIFVFAKTFHYKNRKSQVRWLHRHANFSLDTEVFIFLNNIAIGCVNKTKYLFSPE